MAQRVAKPLTLQDEIRQICMVRGGYPDSWAVHECCPCCTSRGIRPHFEARRFKHWTCSRCRFVFLNPYPPPAVLHELYNGEYFNNVRRFVEIPKCRDGRVDPFSAMPLASYQKIIDYIGSKFRSPELLDVGGGVGAFLNLVRHQIPNAKCTLQELNSESLEFARSFFGFRATNLPPREIARSGDSFNIVTMIAVLEHIPTPHAMLSNVSQLLRPGGILIITVPHHTRFCRMLRSIYATGVNPPFHASLFNRRSIRYLLRRIPKGRVAGEWQSGRPAFELRSTTVRTEMHERLIPRQFQDKVELLRVRDLPPEIGKLRQRLRRIDKNPLVDLFFRRVDGRVYLTTVFERSGKRGQ